MRGTRPSLTACPSTAFAGLAIPRCPRLRHRPRDNAQARRLSHRTSPITPASLRLDRLDTPIVTAAHRRPEHADTEYARPTTSPQRSPRLWSMCRLSIDREHQQIGNRHRRLTARSCSIRKTSGCSRSIDPTGTMGRPKRRSATLNASGAARSPRAQGVEKRDVFNKRPTPPCHRRRHEALGSKPNDSIRPIWGPRRRRYFKQDHQSATADRPTSSSSSEERARLYQSRRR